MNKLSFLKSIGLIFISFFILSAINRSHSKKHNSGTPQKWVWVGTSIPAMYSSQSYPAQVGRMLNDNGYSVTMTNESLASSLVIFGSKLALSATRSELSAKFPGNENNSYETKIPKNTDVLIIDHGYNDRDSLANHLGDINSTDRTTFYGAYNYILKYAYSQNPNIRIAIIIPANNVRWSSSWAAQVKKLNAMRDALLVLASRYGCICVDLMKTMGYNDYTYPILTKDGTHMTQETVNFAAAILFEKLKVLAFDHMQVISYNTRTIKLPVLTQAA